MKQDSLRNNPHNKTNYANQNNFHSAAEYSDQENQKYVYKKEIKRLKRLMVVVIAFASLFVSSMVGFVLYVLFRFEMTDGIKTNSSKLTVKKTFLTQIGSL